MEVGSFPGWMEAPLFEKGKTGLTYARKREPHLVHFDLVYEGHTHAVGQHHEGGDDVHDGVLRQGTGGRRGEGGDFTP